VVHSYSKKMLESGDNQFKKKPCWRGRVNLLHFGADPTNTRDSSAAFEAAIQAALANKTALWIPKGVFAMAKQITLPDGIAIRVTIRGVGTWHSELRWADQTATGLFGKKSTGSQGSIRVELYDFAIRGEIRQAAVR
jgi:hypothetical protein